MLKCMKIRKARPNGVGSVIVSSKDSCLARSRYKCEWQKRIMFTTQTYLERGWKLAFITLTYGTENGKNFEGFRFNSNSVPHLPLELFKSVESYRNVPCFDKSHIQQYFKLLRDYWFEKYRRKYSVNEMFLWSCFAEYGSKKHRPHYHAIILFNPSFVDSVELWTKCRLFWEGHNYGFHGFFGPHCYGGGCWCRTHEKPFLCNSSLATAKYVSKYATKDLDFLDVVRDLDIYKWNECPFKGGKESEDYNPLCDYPSMYRRYFPFHLQSRQFGLGCVEDLTDDQKLDLLSKGIHFVGEYKYRACPEYLRRKLLKNNYYEFDGNGKRIVKSEASDFFRKFADRIYEIDFIRRKKAFENTILNFSTMLSTNNNFAEVCPVEWSLERKQKCFSDIMHEFFMYVGAYGIDEIAKFSLLYYGRKKEYCKAISYGDVYLTKYLRPDELESFYYDDVKGERGSWIRVPDDPYFRISLPRLCVVRFRGYHGNFRKINNPYSDWYHSLPNVPDSYYENLTRACNLLTFLSEYRNLSDSWLLDEERSDNYYSTIIKESCLYES